MSMRANEETQTMTMKTIAGSRLRRAVLSGALLALGTWTLAGASKAAAADPAPAWSIAAAPFPTNFTPGLSGKLAGGPGYYATATNVGAAPTSGPFSITVTVPAPLSVNLSLVTPVDGKIPTGLGTAKNMSCTPAAQTVTCTSSAPLPPGALAVVKLAVIVPEGAPASVVADATVEGGDATPVTTSAAATVNPSVAPFGFAPDPGGFFGMATQADGSAATQAGSHPYQLTIGTNFSIRGTAANLLGAGTPKDIDVRLPRGTVVDPQATPQCTDAQFISQGAGTVGCPDDTQIGTFTVITATGGGPHLITSRFFNMTPTPGTPARLAFVTIGSIPVFLRGKLNSDDEYRLSAEGNDLLARTLTPILGTQTVLWGNPSEASHDSQRGLCINSEAADTCPVQRLDTAFLTMPSDCPGGPGELTGIAKSWEDPDIAVSRDVPTTDSAGSPVSTSGCNQLDFQPTIRSQPTTNVADAPTGLEFDLHVPQNMDFDGLSPANFKDATVTLPEGLAVNPSGADGLGACSEAQIDLEDGTESPDCPNDSKLASVEVSTPLLGHKLPGAVYLAKPYENPFDSLIAIYLVVEDPASGVVAKLAGKVSPNPSTGRLTASFEENPELPIEDVALRFFGGPRAPLRTPATCGSYETTSTIVPWSSPEGADAHPGDAFQIGVNPGGGNCPTTAAQAPHSPSFTAGTIDPVAGAYSPFVLRITRADGSQHLTQIDAKLPQGLTGKLAGIPYCSEAQIATAKAREKPQLGSLELADPSCPAASEVGTVDVAAGAGISPLHVGGKAYLAGPYKGAPLSLVIVTPAVTGPFDLGAVVVRSALRLDPRSAQLTAISDPLPTIIEGIPLDVREIVVRAGRPNFTLNPTSCDPMEIAGQATSVLGIAAQLSSPFQVGACKALQYKPKLSIRLKGGAKRGDHPALTATARFQAGNANTKYASVTLPRTAFLDQAHIRTICTRVQFAAEQCPKGSIYGFAKATTPLLDQPLEGPVYLRSSDNELPDLVAALDGQVSVEVVGRVDSVKGAIRNTFEAAPDAPVSTFTLKMQGGKKGLVVNSRNLCRQKDSVLRAKAVLKAHNGKAISSRPLVRDSCKGKPKRKRPNR